MNDHLELIAKAFLDWAWIVHAFALFLIISVRFFRFRSFIELFGVAALLFIIALGNAINVELSLLAPSGTLTLETTMGLKALSLVSVVVYGAIAGNLMVFAITNEGVKK